MYETDESLGCERKTEASELQTILHILDRDAPLPLDPLPYFIGYRESVLEAYAEFDLDGAQEWSERLYQRDIDIWRAIRGRPRLDRAILALMSATELYDPDESRSLEVLAETTGDIEDGIDFTHHDEPISVYDSIIHTVVCIENEVTTRQDQIDRYEHRNLLMDSLFVANAKLLQAGVPGVEANLKKSLIGNMIFSSLLIGYEEHVPNVGFYYEGFRQQCEYMSQLGLLDDDIEERFTVFKQLISEHAYNRDSTIRLPALAALADLRESYPKDRGYLKQAKKVRNAYYDKDPLSWLGLKFGTESGMDEEEQLLVRRIVRGLRFPLGIAWDDPIERFVALQMHRPMLGDDEKPF